MFDELMDAVNAGEHLPPAEIARLAATADILSLGMLADTVRRRLHGAQVTYLRVAPCGFDQSFTDAVSIAAREIRITGAPPTFAAAVSAVEAAKAVAGERTVSGFSWNDVDRVAAGEGIPLPRALDALHNAGLDAIAEVPLDAADNLDAVIDALVGAGFQDVRLALEKAPAAERTTLLLKAAELQSRCRCIRSINPLPTVRHSSQPTTGYDDVKAVALARLSAPNVPTVQIDWHRYGPKLAQVALTFGADDVDGVSASDDAPEGRRRAPLEEVRRNIEAAGFSPAERDGRFQLVS